MAFMENSEVKVWEEHITIPTYQIGVPDKNPMFLEKRVYQGSSGSVYPHPIIDRILDTKVDKQYTAVYLENRYLKIMLLPEIGGRVQMALDKTNGYHFVYYNQVIKPALVGLTGPWISGGIEFNWPQHHRPSTFDPLDYFIKTNRDGSQTVWIGEIERMFRTKGMAGFTLHADKAYLEITVQLYNRTSEPQTFLWWANPAVPVNDEYQSIFPPDVRAVMDHGKRDVSSFPIATGTYYKMDYSPGTDISRYKNIPVPTSYMAYHSDFDFLGSYDHHRQAGMMHIADHHIVPGKKQWTWGNGDFGRAWDRELTDEDGPYIELMCGAYTDNQPDFSWLQPGEEKSFTQIFMPYKLIGGAQNANKEAVINLQVEKQEAKIGVYLTAARTVCIELRTDAAILFEETVRLDPGSAFQTAINLSEKILPQSLTLRVVDGDRELISFTPLPQEQDAIPTPAQAAKLPSEIETNEGLFLNGLHLEQYRHATYEPEPYYEEALRRDPCDSRSNNAMGLLQLRRGMFSIAEQYFRKAVESLTRRNPNPYDGEPLFYLGLALKFQGRYAEAQSAFYKAVWNSAWQSSGYFELARLSVRNGAFEETLKLIQRSLNRNTLYHQARHLKIAILRRQGQNEKARDEVQRSLELDCLNFGALYENFLLVGDTTYRQVMRGIAESYIELSLDYAHAGLFEEAIALLEESFLKSPMVEYYLGWYYLLQDNLPAAKGAFSRATLLPPDYCFPNQVECVPVLQAAILYAPHDARAHYYLGNFWYGHKRHQEAIEQWELARDLDPTFPTVHRNLGLAYVNKRHDLANGLASYEKAFELNPNDARVFFELDQLHKKINAAPAQRLQRLESHRDLLDQRDDLITEFITLLNQMGRHEDALNILRTRKFHPWEGGEGKVTGQYVLNLVELAKQKLTIGQYTDAIQLLEKAQNYPGNLGEGKLPGAQENNIFYFLGCAYEKLNQADQAHRCFINAASGSLAPASQMYYNDQPPDMIFYQGLANIKLGEDSVAQAVFSRLVEYGQKHLDDDVHMDYFAVSLPDFLIFDQDLNQRNQIHCHYMTGLGYLGLGKRSLSTKHLNKVLELDAYHIGAIIHLKE